MPTRLAFWYSPVIVTYFRSADTTGRTTSRSPVFTTSMIGLNKPTPPRLKKLRFCADAAEAHRPMRTTPANSSIFLMGHLQSYCFDYTPLPHSPIALSACATAVSAVLSRTDQRRTHLFPPPYHLHEGKLGVFTGPVRDFLTGPVGLS